MDSSVSNIGFIGLGAMGFPMAEQLATKLPSTTTIIVYDVVESAINELVEKYPGKVFAGTSPKHVVENSVRFQSR
jgi:3-hydroxyisobutyrate dehydrogenase